MVAVGDIGDLAHLERTVDLHGVCKCVREALMEAQVIWGTCRNLALSPQTSRLCRRVTVVLDGRQRDSGARERISGLEETAEGENMPLK